MSERTPIFPLPAGADIHEQAAVLANAAAWLMSAPGNSDPPARSMPEEDPDASRLEISEVPSQNARLIE
jgi:hypothetical protein